MPPSDRQNTRHRAASTSKPYERRDSPSSPTTSDSTVETPSGATCIREPTGFPSLAEYKRVETAYVLSLNPVKRGKALITQQMFDDIWDILHDPGSSLQQTSQFRWWVRKMFTLSRNTGEDSDARPTIVLHDNRPVATVGQLYEILCYCHARASHGGRDRTLAVVRKLYSWVPKRLVAAFISVCPTCNATPGKKRRNSSTSRNSGATSSSLQETISTKPVATNREPYGHSGSSTSSLESLHDTDSYIRPVSHASPTSSVPLADGLLALGQSAPVSTSLPEAMSCQQCGEKADISSLRLPSPDRNLSYYLPSSTSPVASRSMSREVSLFNSMPKEMQFMVEDEEDYDLAAYEQDFSVASAKLPQSKRARIPSVMVPRHQWSHNPTEPYCQLTAEKDYIPRDTYVALPPLTSCLSRRSSGREMDLLSNELNRPASLPGSMRELRVNDRQLNDVVMRRNSTGSIVDAHMVPSIMTPVDAPQIGYLTTDWDAVIGDDRTADEKEAVEALHRFSGFPSSHSSPNNIFFSSTKSRPVPLRIDLGTARSHINDLMDFIPGQSLGQLEEMAGPTSAGSTSSTDSAHSQLSAFSMSAASSPATPLLPILDQDKNHASRT